MKTKIIISVIAIIAIVALAAVFLTGGEKITGAITEPEDITGASAAECDYTFKCVDGAFYGCDDELIASCADSCESETKCEKTDGFIEVRNVAELESVYGPIEKGSSFYAAVIEGSIGITYECNVVDISGAKALTDCNKT